MTIAITYLPNPSTVAPAELPDLPAGFSGEAGPRLGPFPPGLERLGTAIKELIGVMTGRALVLALRQKPGPKPKKADRGRAAPAGPKAGRKPGPGAEPEEPGPEPGDEDPGEKEPRTEEADLVQEETEEESDDEEAKDEVEEPESRTSGPGSGREDLEFIEGFLSGSEEDFNRLVLKYQHKVFNLCYRILGDRDESQDMAQEVFLTLHRSLKDFRGESLFSTWVFRVTVNHCKNRIKYLSRRKYYQLVSLDQPRDTGEGEMFIEAEDESPDPEDRMGSEEVQTLVQEAISGLDPEHRMVIVLRDIQDLSYEEIAKIVGIRVGTVKSRIHRARNDLKKKLTGKIKL